MKNRWVQSAMALCAVLFLLGGIVYFIKDNEHQSVKKRYDAYAAQLDDYIEKHGIPELSEEPPEYAELYDKFFEAETYLEKNAPHLLTQEKKMDYSGAARHNAFFMEKLAQLRKEDPAAAADLESKLAEMDREYEAEMTAISKGSQDSIEYLQKHNPEAASRIKREYEAAVARIDAEGDRFRQEMLDHEAHMKKSAEAREVRKQKRLVDKREREADMERLDDFIDELRSHLNFDVNGKVIGVKENSIFTSDNVERPHESSDNADNSKPDVAVSDESVTRGDKSENSVTNSTKPIRESTTDDPVLWREMAKTEMAGIHNGFNEKYPDVLIRPHLTDTEYQSFFPDAASRERLQKRTDALQTEYVNRIRPVFDRTPRQQQSALIEMARETLSEEWDADFVDAIITKVQQREK